ncbi:MAG: CPBP family intramembrane glutamic endopeptidase [Candidatus Acidiferrales bacterium]
MNPAIPWDLGLILAVLGIVVPWRGAVRVRRLLSRPQFGTADRLSLYGTTIAFQWILAFVVLWRSLSHSIGFSALGLTVSNPVRTTWITLILTGVLCAGQLASLRRILRLSSEERGSLFHITEKIMPRTLVEIFVFVALACTAGLSEEFLYRGFLFAMFSRMLENSPLSVAIAALLSSIWFAVAHLYQGRRGVITTFVVGMIFMLARISTASLIPSIVAHAGVDLIAGLYISISYRTVRKDV